MTSTVLPAPALRCSGHKGRVISAYALPAVVAGAATQTWFRPGLFVAQGDIAPFIRTSTAQELYSLWNHELSGAGSPSFQIVRLLEVELLRLAGAFGASAVAAQRLYYALAFVAAALGATYFASRLVGNRLVVSVAGLVAVFNPLVLSHTPSPFVPMMIGVCGLLGGLALDAAAGRTKVWQWAIGSSPVFVLGNNLALLAVAAAWTVVVLLLGSMLVGPGGTRRALTAAVRAAPLVVALHLWWLVPLAFTFTSNISPGAVVSQDVRVWAWTHANATLLNSLTLTSSWLWTHPEYLPFVRRLDSAPWVWLRFVIPAFCLAAAGFVRPLRRVRTLVAIVVALVFLAKGLHEPFAAASLFAYDHFPGLWLLREPTSKVGPLLVVVYGALVVLGLAAVPQRWPSTSRAQRALLVALVVIPTIVAAYPLWTGSVIPGERRELPAAHVKIPPAWKAVAKELNRSPAVSKALVLPLAKYYQVRTTWGYYGTDVIPQILLERPTIQPPPEAYFASGKAFEDTVHRVESALQGGNSEPVAALLHELGVGYVVVRRDIVDPSAPGTPDELVRGLAIVPEVSEVLMNDVASVFSVGGRVLQARSRDGRLLPARTERLSASHYRLSVAEATEVAQVVLTETYSPGWEIRGRAASVTHERMGYANSWRLSGLRDRQIEVVYGPARVASLARWVSLVALLACIGLCLFRTLSHATRQPPKPQDE